MSLSVMRMGAADVEHSVVAEDAPVAVNEHISLQAACVLLLAGTMRGHVAMRGLQARRLILTLYPVPKLVVE